MPSEGGADWVRRLKNLAPSFKSDQAPGNLKRNEYALDGDLYIDDIDIFQTGQYSAGNPASCLRVDSGPSLHTCQASMWVKRAIAILRHERNTLERYFRTVDRISAPT